MKPITEMYFGLNDITSDESWFWFSESKQESYVMYSEEEFRENQISQSQNKASLKNYGQFLLLRSSFTTQTTREYEKLDSILSYMGGFIQMVFVLTGFVMEFYNMQSLMLQLANQLYSFQTPTELKGEDKDISKFETRQDFLRSIFSQIFSQVKKLNLNLSYIIYRLSCRKVFKTSTNILIHQAMKQVDQDLNIFEILDRLHEVDKMKKVLFTEEQKKIFEFSYKPTFNLESIQNNLKIKQIQKIEAKRIKRNKLKQLREDRRTNRIQRKEQQYDNHKEQKLSLITQTPLNNKTDPKQGSCVINTEDIKLNQKPKQNFMDVVAQIAYFKNKKNQIRISHISQLLIEEGQQIYTQFAQTTYNNLNTKPLINIGTFREEKNSEMCQSLIGGNIKQKEANNLFSYHNMSQPQINNITPQYGGGAQNNLYNSQNFTPLQSYLNQNKKKKSDNLLLNLIEVLRPQTFYSQRMDYSKFSAFYELYEAYEQSTNVYQNNRSQIKTTQKILQFLGQDIRDVFQQAARLPNEEELLKQERIKILIDIFIQNLKKSIGRESASQYKVNDEVINNNNQRGFDIQSNYQLKFNNMNQLNERSDLLIRGRNTQSLTNMSNYSSAIQNTENINNPQDYSITNQKNMEKSFGILIPYKAESEYQNNSSQNSPVITKSLKKSLNKEIKFDPKVKALQQNTKRYSLQFQYDSSSSDKNNTLMNQITGGKNNNFAGSSIFRQTYNQKFQPKSIVDISRFQDLNNSSNLNDNSEISMENINNNQRIIKFQQIQNDDQSEQIVPSQKNIIELPQWEHKNLQQMKTEKSITCEEKLTVHNIQNEKDFYKK